MIYGYLFRTIGINLDFTVRTNFIQDLFRTGLWVHTNKFILLIELLLNLFKKKFMSPSDPDQKKKPFNYKWISAYVSLLFAILTVGIALYPFVSSTPFVQIGGMTIFGGFFSLFTVPSCIAKFREARTIDKMRKGEGVLAHWTYTQNEWDTYLTNSRLDKTFQSSGGRVFISLGILVLLLVYAISSKNIQSIVPTAILLVVMLPIFFVWFLNYMMRLRNRKRLGEIIICDHGVLINSEYLSFYRYKGPMQVQINETPFLHFVITYTDYQPGTQLTGKKPYYIHVPIPSGKLLEAKRIAERLTNAKVALPRRTWWGGK